MMSIYRTILKSSWSILWRGKFLWLFGLFAALLGGNGGELNLMINNFNSVKSQGEILGTLRSWKESGGQFTDYLGKILSNFDLTLSLITVISILVFIFIVWLIIVSQVSLIDGAYKMGKKKETSFNNTFSVGKVNFWPVFSLNLIMKLAVYVLFLIVGLPLGLFYINSSSNAALTWLFILSFIILVPLAIILSLVGRYAIMFCVVKAKNVKDSVKEGWALLQKNWLVSIEMVLVLFVVNIAWFVAGLLVAAILAIPFLVLGYVFYIFEITVLLAILQTLGVLMIVALMLWVLALSSTYYNTVWTLLYTRLSEGLVYPKLERVFAAMKIKKTGDTV